MIKIKLKEQLANQKMSQYKLQKITGWNLRRVKAFYKEEAIEIKVSEIDKLCELFNCKVQDLLEYVAE